MGNINSFSENIRQVVKSQANSLDMLAAMQKSLTTNDSYVAYTQEDGSGNLESFQMPSVASLATRLESVESALSSLASGKSTISLVDGTSRQMKLSSVASAPPVITNSAAAHPTTFSIDSNWFFENFMFPGAQVTIDLNGEIADIADRCRVKRVIIDSRSNAAKAAWANDIYPSQYTYQQLITYLSANGIEYSEDEDTVDFPLVRNNFYGAFQIAQDPITRDGNIWYQLDTITYRTVTADGIDNGSNNTLAIGDQLAYNNTIYSIIDLDANAKRVRLRLVSGTEVPGMNSILKYYDYPEQAKELKIRFGAHEYNIIYLKAVQEDYNLMCDTWSAPYMFESDALLYEGDNMTTYALYYVNNVVDWGSDMIAEAKERNIKAYNGKVPNAPVLYAGDYRVVQINTQINAALDNTDIKSTANEIVTTKSNINSLKATIASQKTELQTITNYDEYQALLTQINNNTTELDALQTSYSTLVSYLQSLAKENSAVTTDPKYHVRGFFDIPELQYTDEEQTQPQQIIGFEIAYRYIKEDETGVALNTYTYTGTGGSGSMQGVFSDWNMETGKTLEKVYNESTGTYQWSSEDTASATSVNINQIDIAISKGEKVEFKVRAISEAGYPANCLKSEWSNSVIVPFPSNLSTTNEIADLIQETNSESVSLTIDNTLKSLGVNAHLSDTISNSESITGVYYKHTASNLAYEKKNGSNNTVETISVQDILDGLIGEYDIINTGYVDLNTKYSKIIDYVNTDLSTLINVSVAGLEEDVSVLYDGMNSFKDINNKLIYDVSVFSTNYEDRISSIEAFVKDASVDIRSLKDDVARLDENMTSMENSLDGRLVSLEDAMTILKDSMDNFQDSVKLDYDSAIDAAIAPISQSLSDLRASVDKIINILTVKI